MSAPVFDDLPARTQASLARVSAAVAGVHPLEVRTWRLPVSSLPAESRNLPLADEVAEWAAGSAACVYYFECASQNVNLQKVEEGFLHAKALEASDRALPRLNAPAHCLYVGSSRSIAKRLYEHLGYGARQTYALHLVHWAPKLSLELTFVCAKYPPATPSFVVEALEDTLWEMKTPMFGRRGRK